MSELAEYDYDLPRHLIAQSPLAQRADARLLVVDRAANSLEHRYIRDLPEILRPDDCLVLNNTRVLPARLLGFRSQTGGRWEGLFLEAEGSGFWRVMCKTRGKLLPGETITLVDSEGRESLRLRLGTKEPEGVWIVRPESSESPLDLLNRVGRVPLPPYIRKGEMVAADASRYQTVFAEVPGAIAAPTAGLHFTKPLLAQLGDRGIHVANLTLHVGPGTFRPIESECLDAHVMHAEWANLEPGMVREIETCRQRGGRVVAVGSTSVRVLETAAAGSHAPEPRSAAAQEAGETEAPRSGRDSLRPFRGSTDLFIRPPYRFRAVDVLLTNFHLPRTTLLVLVRTFGGDALMHRAYDEAIREEYRFYSYGDAMLIV